MRRKLAWLIGCVVLVAFGIHTASYRPLPFDFLSKFPVISNSEDAWGTVHLVLDADYAEVAKAAHAEIGCRFGGYQPNWTAASCGFPGDLYVHIEQRRIQYRPDGSPTVSNRRCSVSYIRKNSLAEDAWKWIRARFERADSQQEVFSSRSRWTTP